MSGRAASAWERAGTLHLQTRKLRLLMIKPIRALRCRISNPFTALFIIDAVSRKYFTSETS